MSEDPTAAASAAGEQTPASEIEEKPAALGQSGGDDAPLGGADNGDGAASPQTWREDWREALAGEDEAYLRYLKRFASPENYAKSYKGLQAKLTRGETLATLPDDATPEEIAAYRKNAGVPETPDAYDFKFPPEIGPAEQSKAALDAFKARMHERHIGANDRGAHEAFAFYTETMIAGQAAREQATEEAREQNIADLRSAWPGREFARNTRLAEEFMKGEGAFAHFEEPLFDEKAAKLIRNARVPLGDGTEVELRLYAPFVKGMANLARKLADPEALLGGDGAGGGTSLEAERKALLAKGRLTPDEDKRLTQIYEALNPDFGPRRGRAA